MNQITKHNLVSFLQFFGNKINKQFTAEQIEKWNNIPDASLSEQLRKLLDYYNYNTPQKQRELIAEFSRIPNTERAHQDIENSPIIPTSPVYTNTHTASDWATQEVSNLQNVQGTHVNNDNFHEPKKKSKTWIWISFSILFLALIGAVGYIWNEYNNYQSRPQVYCLANNLNIRKSLDSEEKWGTRMDLFGEYKDASGQLHQSVKSLPLASEEKIGDYYKVYMDSSFTQYLTDKSSTVGYIHSKYVTTRLSEYEKYIKVFQYYSDDYFEMESLPVIYRRILVNAIENYAPLNGKVIAPPCYKDKTYKRNSPKSIAQIKLVSGNASEYYVVTRMNDGKYYSIKSNADATELTVYPVTVEGFLGSDEFTEPGKFKFIEQQETYGDIEWQECSGNEKAVSTIKPFDQFQSSHSIPALIDSIFSDSTSAN